MKIFRSAFPIVVLGLVPLASCTQAQKHEEVAETASAQADRSLASANDFEFDRAVYTGSLSDLKRELKLMRGNLERGTILGLAAKREALLTQNLFDTGVDDGKELDCASIMAMGRPDFVLHHRTADGTCYMHGQGRFFKSKSEVDLSSLKKMGANGQRFGRNTAPPTQEQINEAEKSVLEPNPVVISQTFFSRVPKLAPATDGFHPVPWVNLLASAWLQAENHDWFSHGKNVDMSHVPPEQQQAFAKLFEPYKVDGFIIPRTRPDVSFVKSPQKQLGVKYQANGQPGSLEGANAHYGVKFRNTVTHWWDASHIYGSDAEIVKRVRTIPSGVTYSDASGKTYKEGELYPDGKIAVDEKNRKLYYRPDPRADGEVLPITGFSDNWWVGLEMIHITFALEHNKVVDHLKAQFEKTPASKGEIFKYYHSIKNDPAKRGDFLFEKARLVVSALIAKIHTVEWTPALLDNPGLRMAMYANWNGLKPAFGDPEAPKIRGLLEVALGQDARMLLSGLTGEGTLNLFKVPFSLTQEFVSVYRMHPLLPDKVDLIRYNSHKDVVEKSVPVDSTRDTDVDALIGGSSAFTSTDWMYSFGRNKAGLMTLHNYPKFMESMKVRRNVQGQKKDDPVVMNMGAVDLVRDRERQTPRYNAFRRALRLRPIHNFEELFVTSKVLYEDASKQSPAYQKAVAKLREQVRAAGYDVPMIERDIEKIPALNPLADAKNLLTGGKESYLNSGRKLASEQVFYDLYFQLPQEEQLALLTEQEMIDIANMKKLYNGDVDKLDLLVGTLAEEDRYENFGFGNTPFYIFLLMASRRLMSDPFFSDLYTDDVYSPAGKAWVERENMVSVLTRNFPELKSKFVGVKNAFHPWNPN